MGCTHEGAFIFGDECLDCRMEKLERRLVILTKALAFYASPKTYDDYGIPRSPHQGHKKCKAPDQGRIAREALGIIRTASPAGGGEEE